MWKRLSFRTQLFLPLGVMFVAALIMGGVLLQMFATGQLADENEPARRSAQTVATALNHALRTSEDPRRALDAFVQALDASAPIQFRPAEAGPRAAGTAPPQNPHGVPQWFIDLLVVPDVETAFPVEIDGKRVGDIAFLPNLSADFSRNGSASSPSRASSSG